MLSRRVNLPTIEEFQEATFTTEIALTTHLIQNLFKGSDPLILNEKLLFLCV